VGGLVAGLSGCSRPAPALLLAKSPPLDGRPVLTLPFEFYREFIFVKVNVNGSRPLSFLLDSGSSDHQVGLGTARALRLSLGWFHDDTGSAVGEQKTESSSARHVSVALGDAQIYEGTVKVSDMAPVEQWLKKPVDGIVGAPLFEAYVVQIDYVNHVLRLFDPRKYELTGKQDIVPIRITNRQPFVNGMITKDDGTSVIANLAVDTGADSPLSLNTPFDTRNGLPGHGGIKATNGTGLGGIAPDVYGRLKNLKIGKSSFPDIPTFFSLATRGQEASDKYDGTIGNYLLAHFVVTFDYQHNKMILQPASVGTTGN